MSKENKIPKKIENKIIKKDVTLNKSKGEAKKSIDTFQANTADTRRKKKK